VEDRSAQGGGYGVVGTIWGVRRGRVDRCKGIRVICGFTSCLSPKRLLELVIWFGVHPNSQGREAWMEDA